MPLGASAECCSQTVSGVHSEVRVAGGSTLWRVEVNSKLTWFCLPRNHAFCKRPQSGGSIFRNFPLIACRTGGLCCPHGERMPHGNRTDFPLERHHPTFSVRLSSNVGPPYIPFRTMRLRFRLRFKRLSTPRYQRVTQPRVRGPLSESRSDTRHCAGVGRNLLRI